MLVWGALLGPPLWFGIFCLLLVLGFVESNLFWLALVPLALSVYAAAHLGIRIVSRMRARTGQLTCGSCGYDLQGLIKVGSSVCPECGKPIECPICGYQLRGTGTLTTIRVLSAASGTHELPNQSLELPGRPSRGGA